jgi:beta-lactamase regulating signal transducer with metallopeptidase domain
MIVNYVALGVGAFVLIAVIIILLSYRGYKETERIREEGEENKKKYTESKERLKKNWLEIEKRWEQIENSANSMREATEKGVGKR